MGSFVIFLLGVLTGVVGMLIFFCLLAACVKEKPKEKDTEPDPYWWKKGEPPPY